MEDDVKIMGPLNIEQIDKMVDLLDDYDVPYSERLIYYTPHGTNEMLSIDLTKYHEENLH